jgi:hypothetical protein
MAAAGRAKDQLASQLLANPNVSLIDIGLDPHAAAGQSQTPVLRVHLKSEGARNTVSVPEQVNGIPVRTLVANYKLE